MTILLLSLRFLCSRRDSQYKTTIHPSVCEHCLALKILVSLYLPSPLLLEKRNIRQPFRPAGGSDCRTNSLACHCWFKQDYTVTSLVPEVLFLEEVSSFITPISPSPRTNYYSYIYIFEVFSFFTTGGVLMTWLLLTSLEELVLKLMSSKDSCPRTQTFVRVLGQQVGEITCAVHLSTGTVTLSSGFNTRSVC